MEAGEVARARVRTPVPSITLIERGRVKHERLCLAPRALVEALRSQVVFLGGEPGLRAAGRAAVREQCIEQETTDTRSRTTRSPAPRIRIWTLAVMLYLEERSSWYASPDDFITNARAVYLVFANGKSSLSAPGQCPGPWRPPNPGERGGR